MTRPGEIAAPAGRQPLSIEGLLRRYRYVVAAADQVAVSLLNFALTFALVRLLSATEFGAFGLWLAAANLAIGVQSALVSMPLVVHAPAESDDARRHRLEEAVASVNLLVVILCGLVALIVNCVSEAPWVAKDLLTGAVIPLFIAVGLYREYYRSLAFGRRDMILLLATDGAYIAVTAAGIGAMLLCPQTLRGLAGAFIALTLGGIAAQLCSGLRLLRRRLRLLRAGWTEPYRGIFGEAMWSLAGVVSTHVHLRGYAYIATGLVGLAQLAALNAVGILFRPAQILLTAWRRSALPEFAALLAAGRGDAVHRRTLAASAAALSGCVAWGAVLSCGWRAIEHYLLAEKYPEASLLLLPWTITVALDAITFIVSTALSAAREFRYLAWVTLCTAPITLAGTAGLTLWHGYTWTMYGLALGNALSVAMVVARLYMVRRGACYPGAAAFSGAQPAELSEARR